MNPCRIVKAEHLTASKSEAPARRRSGEDNNCGGNFIRDRSLVSKVRFGEELTCPSRSLAMLAMPHHGFIGRARAWQRRSASRLRA